MTFYAQGLCKTILQLFVPFAPIVDHVRDRFESRQEETQERPKKQYRLHHLQVSWLPADTGCSSFSCRLKMITGYDTLNAMSRRQHALDA